MSGKQRSFGLLLRGLILIAIAAVVLSIAYVVVKDPSSPSAVIAISHEPPVHAKVGPVLNLGKGRAAMASGPAGLWVTRTPPTGVPGRLIEIDTSTGQIKQEHPLDIVPISLAVGRNVVWVLGSKPGSELATVLRVDPATGLVTARAPLAEAPACATHPFASCYPVATRDGVWVPLIDRIVHVPPSGTMADRSVPLGGHVWDLAAGSGHQLWALAEVGLYRIDERTAMSRLRIPLKGSLGPGLQANHIVANRHAVWISSFPRNGDQPPGRITFLDPKNTQPSDLHSRIYPGAGSLALVGGGLWLDRYDGQGELDRLDETTGNLTGPFVTVEDDVTAIAARDGNLWILSYHPDGNTRTVTEVTLTPDPGH